MNKNLTLTIIFCLFVSSLFLISSQANAGAVSPPPPPSGSNCCFADNMKCDVGMDDDDWGDGDDWCECEVTTKTEGKNHCEEEGPRAGCDDSSCENLVCQIDPECCQENMIHWDDDDSGWDDDDDGGWNQDCADLANEFCDVCGGQNPLEAEITSDEDPFQLYSFFDLRDRESFVQVTNVSDSPVTVHVQVFDVNNNCNENNFYDLYTGADTHVYNMRDILTNDGKPSGFVLPDNAYGIVAITVVTGVGGSTDQNSVLIGNFRILDNLGYEYRTNSLGIRTITTVMLPTPNFYFNYNVKGNVTLSDVVGIALEQNISEGEIVVSPQDTHAEFDIDIFNTNEVPFSCRDIIFACIDDDNPLLEQLLEDVGGASVASFEYGINNAIPHSKGGELLCPGNNISDGVVVLRPESIDFDEFVVYIGLNNGNGRGSMDSFWFDNFFISNQGG